MDIKTIIDELLLDVSQFHPIPNLSIKEHVDTLIMICEQGEYAYLVPAIKAALITEAPSSTPLKTPTDNAKEQADKLGLVHLGRGYYGKKEGQPASHKKDDSGKIVELDPEEKAKLDTTAKDTRPVSPTPSPTQPTTTSTSTTNGEQQPVAPAPQPLSPEETARIEKEKQSHADAKEDPESILGDPKASPRSQAVARAQKTTNDIDAIEKQKAEKEAENKAKQEDGKNTVHASEITAQMPDADGDTFGSESDILDTVDPNLIKKFNTNIKKVGEMVAAAKAKGEPAPDINLCTITVPGTNLYCDDNLGIPREQMPQFKGKPVAGSRADKMQLDKSGEVDTEPVFKEMLKQKNIKVLNTQVPADKLKATQSELVGAKVVGMMDMLEKDPENEAITAPIYVSRDGFVIDGHHRWAAVVAYNAKHPEKHIPMKTTVIDMDIKDAIPMANKFAEDMGIAVKKADANKEGGANSDMKNKIAPIKDADPVGTPAQDAESGKKYYSIGGGYYSETPNGPAQWKIIESVFFDAVENQSTEDFNMLFEATTKIKTRDKGVKTAVSVSQKPKTQKVIKHLASKAASKSHKIGDVNADALRMEFSKKGEATQGLLHTQYKMLHGDTPVRQLTDETGNIINVSTPEGRKSAINVLGKRINGLNNKIQLAVKNYGSGINVVQKWLGEVGEMTALKEILGQNVEAYLLTDSERKNDIVFVKPNGTKKGLFMGYISVKTTKGEGVVNKRGANCKADLDKLSTQGAESVNLKFGGKSYVVKPTNVIGSIIDVKSGFFRQYSSQDVTEKVKVEGKLYKLTKYNPTKHGKVPSTDLVKDSKGNAYFSTQASYLRNTFVSPKDAAAFFDNPQNDIYYTNLSKPTKGESNVISDEKEKSQTKEYIKNMVLNEISNWKKLNPSSTKPYSLADLHETMNYVIGNMIETAGIPIAATGDTMAIHYMEGSNTPKVGIIKKSDANGEIQRFLEQSSQIKDSRARQIFLTKHCLGMSSRTRAVEGKGGKYVYDGIDNMEPVSKTKIPKETPISNYIKEESSK